MRGTGSFEAPRGLGIDRREGQLGVTAVKPVLEVEEGEHDQQQREGEGAVLHDGRGNSLHLREQAGEQGLGMAVRRRPSSGAGAASVRVARMRAGGVAGAGRGPSAPPATSTQPTWTSSTPGCGPWSSSRLSTGLLANEHFTVSYPAAARARSPWRSSPKSRRVSASTPPEPGRDSPVRPARRSRPPTDPTCSSDSPATRTCAPTPKPRAGPPCPRRPRPAAGPPAT